MELQGQVASPARWMKTGIGVSSATVSEKIGLVIVPASSIGYTGLAGRMD